MDKRLAMESKQVMGEPLGRRSASVRIENAGSNPASPATETAPGDGGIRQMDGASALSSLNSTSRESLPNSCERSLGDAEAARLGEVEKTESARPRLSSPTIITEPVAAENNKQRER